MEPENKSIPENAPVPVSDPVPEETRPNGDNKAPETAEDTPTKEELAAFHKWQESQKTESAKQAAALSKANNSYDSSHDPCLLML